MTSLLFSVVKYEEQFYPKPVAQEAQSTALVVMPNQFEFRYLLLSPTQQEEVAMISSVPRGKGLWTTRRAGGRVQYADGRAKEGFSVNKRPGVS